MSADDYCDHGTSTVIEQAPGPGHVHRCDDCGWLFRVLHEHVTMTAGGLNEQDRRELAQAHKGEVIKGSGREMPRIFTLPPDEWDELQRFLDKRPTEIPLLRRVLDATRSENRK